MPESKPCSSAYRNPGSTPTLIAQDPQKKAALEAEDVTGQMSGLIYGTETCNVRVEGFECWEKFVHIVFRYVCSLYRALPKNEAPFRIMDPLLQHYPNTCIWNGGVAFILS